MGISQRLTLVDSILLNLIPIFRSKVNETVFNADETANGKTVSQGEVSSAVTALGAFLQVLCRL